MISDILTFINQSSVLDPVNFICHLIIFVGGFYVAIHSRILPKWAITGLWYIGISSLLIALTILAEWIEGPLFLFSYATIGPAADFLLHLNLAIMVSMMFVHTVYKDFKGMRNRHKECSEDIDL